MDALQTFTESVNYICGQLQGWHLLNTFHLMYNDFSNFLLSICSAISVGISFVGCLLECFIMSIFLIEFSG